jgi:hypothetical protein
MMNAGRRILMMAEISRLMLIACICGCVHPFPAFACRYNVREVGFVDLGIERYRLYGYVDQNTPAEITSSFEQISYAALLESNIEAEIIDVNQQKDHPAIKYLDSLQLAALAAGQIQTFPSARVRAGPSAVLVSPDGQTLAVPLTKPGSAARDFEQALRSALDDILSSPKRNEILQQVAKAYGVVLLIESADGEQNKKAKEAVRGAIKQVAGQMQYLPKPIAHPPALIEVSQASLSQENVLLWSLGLDKDKLDQPHAAVLYGRGRWVGPMFKGEQITQDNLTAVLFVIGEDCECGFDHRWLQGTMLPARWDQNLQAQAAESLGFDPESPMIKAEISWIVGRGISSYPDVPLGYQELVVESQPEGGDGAGHPQAALEDATQPGLQPAQEKSGPGTTGVPAKHRPSWGVALVASLAVLIIAIGLFIVFRARKNL